jgi:hypothetical protein
VQIDGCIEQQPWPVPTFRVNEKTEAAWKAKIELEESSKMYISGF